MKKRLIALILALILALSLTACGAASGGVDHSASGGMSGDFSTSQEPSEELPADGSASLPEELPNGSQSATDSEPSTPPSTSKPDSSKPVASKPDSSGPSTSKPNSSKPNTSKPSGTEDKTADLTAFYTTLSSGDDFPAMSQLTGDALDSFYPGLTDLKPKQTVIYTAMISAVACEVALVEVGSSADVKAVKDIFQARIDYQIDQGAFYPTTVEAWQSSAKIVSNGNCVMLVCYDGAAAAVDSFNALFQ